MLRSIICIIIYMLLLGSYTLKDHTIDFWTIFIMGLASFFSGAFFNFIAESIINDFRN